MHCVQQLWTHTSFLLLKCFLLGQENKHLESECSREGFLNGSQSPQKEDSKQLSYLIPKQAPSSHRATPPESRQLPNPSSVASASPRPSADLCEPWLAFLSASHPYIETALILRVPLPAAKVVLYTGMFMPPQEPGSAPEALYKHLATALKGRDVPLTEKASLNHLVILGARLQAGPPLLFSRYFGCILQESKHISYQLGNYSNARSLNDSPWL